MKETGILEADVDLAEPEPEPVKTEIKVIFMLYFKHPQMGFSTFGKSKCDNCCF